MGKGNHSMQLNQQQGVSWHLMIPYGQKTANINSKKRQSLLN
jgi:hypothetical protein